MTAVVYTGVVLAVSPPLNLIADDGKELVVRLAAMYALVLWVSLIARFERARRQAAVEGERRLQRERIELSQTIHDTTAQTAYMIGLGIDAARKLAGDSNEELAARLEATSRLSKSAIWQLRHPIDMGRLFDGRELGGTLESHVATFTSVTSVEAELTQSGGRASSLDGGQEPAVYDSAQRARQRLPPCRGEPGAGRARLRRG